MDISQFLVDVLQVNQVMPEKEAGLEAVRVTYHDPCHLQKSLGVSAQPRDIIRVGGDCTFVEMKDAGTCCGNGGSFNLQNCDLSRFIGMKKRDNIVACGADIVATSCPACMMQIRDVLSQNHHKVKVKHVIEIYADSLN